MGLSAISAIYTISYGTIAGTWTPAIPPFNFYIHHFWNFRPPHGTFLMYLMGLSAILFISTLFLIRLSPVL